MKGLGLSPEQIENRRKHVQAGDVSPIMAGKWSEVWREKMGLAQPEDLSDKLAVQMGSFTEPFNLAWCMKTTGRGVVYFSANPLMARAWLELTGQPTTTAELVVSKRYPWLACSLDAMSTTSKGHRCVLDAKHVGALNEATILRYTPGMTLQAIVCETDWWALSVFIGNAKWELVEQAVDPFYAEEIVETTREFWGYVERGEEPRDRDQPALPPAPEKRLRNIDLSAEFGSPEWLALVERYNWAGECAGAINRFRETLSAATAHAIAREDLKRVVPDDVGTLRRDDFLLTRAKNNAVTMKIEKGGK